MQFIFIVVALTGLLYLLWSKRTFDLFTAAYAGSCVYFLPGFVGYLPDGPRRDVAVDIHPQTYAAMLSVLVACLLGAIVKDLFGTKRVVVTRDVANRYLPRIALAIALSGVGMTLFYSGYALFSHNKHVLMETLTRWYILWVFGASLATVTAFLHRQWVVFAVAGTLLLFNVFIGFRAAAAMTFIAVTMLHLSQKGPRRLLTGSKKPLLIALMIGVFFFAYKKAYQSMKLGDYETVRNNLVDRDFYLRALFESEPFTTQSILNTIIESDFHTGWNHLLRGVVMQIIPISRGQRANFNDLFQNALYRDHHAGMACNIWAEMIAVAGWPLFLSFLFLFVLSLGFGERLIKVQNLGTRGAWALCLSYWVFYIHRNELTYQLNLEKRVLMIWLLSIVGTMLFTGRSALRTPKPLSLGRRIG